MVNPIFSDGKTRGFHIDPSLLQKMQRGMLLKGTEGEHRDEESFQNFWIARQNFLVFSMLMTVVTNQNAVTNITAGMRDCSYGHFIAKNICAIQSGQFRNSPHVRWAE